MSHRAKRRPQTRAERRKSGRTARSTPTPWRKILAFSAAGIVVIAIGFAMYQSAGRQSEVSAEVEALAAANAAGQPIETHTGTRHTVYHASTPLPTAESPRADGRPTLVWFSGTWCEFCEQMDPFAHATASTFQDRLVFVEKSIDHDRQARGRYGIVGTPTFVLIDAAGNELGRFGFQRDRASFTAAIEQSLAQGT
jgi:thiol-disulfide isomerase/thioredoxin